MTAFTEHPFDSPDSGDARSVPERLPADFNPRLVGIDSLIARQAQHDLADGTPDGLADRVFDASVELLPQTTARPLRLAPTSASADRIRSRFALWGMSRMSSRMVWGRVAMAASVALVFGLGALMMHTANLQPAKPSTPLAKSHGDAARADNDSFVTTLADAASDLESSPFGSVEDFDRRVGYLRDANDVTSLEEVRPELNSLIASIDR
jgi:hypothetical protein